MVKKRLRDMFRKVKPGARERSPTDPPAPISVPAEPAVPPPVVDRSLAEYLSAAVEAREAGRFDEADGLLTEAIERFPDEPRPRFDWALLPHFRLDWTEAVRRSEIVRAEFPDAPAAHVLGAIVLRELDRLDDAENLLAAARERFPDDLRLANESAWLATHRRDWLEALRRWDLVRGQFPDWPGGYTGVAMIQRELRWFGEAEATLAEAVERFPAEPEPYIDYARVAEARGDWPAATLRWELVRESFPDRAAGYVGGAAALRELGRADEAEALTAEAAERFSTDATAAAEHAGTEPVARATFDSDAASPLASAESPETIAESATLTTEAPQPPGEVAPAGRSLAEYLDAATELRAARRLDEANALLAEAMEHFRDDPDLLSESGRVAEWRSDWPEAARHWEAVHNLLPGHALAHIGHARALIHDGRHDAAETLLEDAARRFPENFEILMVRAESAAQRRDWPEALQRWEEFRAGFPDSSEGYLGAVLASRELGRIEEAEELLAEAIERFPTERRLHVERALLSHVHRDWTAAAERWERVRAGFPDEPAAHVLGAVAVRELGRFDEAEALLAAARQRFPNDFGAEHEYAWLATIRGDFAEALERWDTLSERFPDRSAGLAGVARVLRQAGRFEDAELVLSEAVECFPAEIELAADHAEVAEARGDWDAAISRWATLRERAPAEVRGYTLGARALHSAGRHDEAATLLADAENLFPGSKEVAQAVFEARLRLAGAGLDGRTATAGAPAVHADDPELMHCLVMDFESLGGSGHGCEFGVFQREFGAEPLGLLRWADLAPHLLAEALEREFEGVGLAENTVLFVPPGDRPEYWTRDSRYWMAMRTFVAADATSEEQMRELACRRLQFLRDKLIGDLQAGEKIFVFKVIERNLTDEEIGRLHAAMRRYGDNTLLYVRYEDEEHPNGTVEVAADGLMIGYIDRFNFSRTDENLGPATESWTAVCRAAHSLWKAGAPVGTTEIIVKTQSEIDGVKLIFTKDLVEGRSFSFSRGDGTVIHPDVRLQTDGTLGSFSTESEHGWDQEDGNLVFKNSLGRATTVFDVTEILDGAYKFHGRFLPKGSNIYWHYLHENRVRQVLPAAVAKADARTAGQNEVAVLVRTHKADAKFAELMTKLDKGRSGFDLFATIDETNGRPDVEIDNVIWNSVEASRELGLTQPHQAFMIYLEVPLYFALREIPSYKYYLMIEDDVDLVRSDASFLNAVCERLREPDYADVDLVSLQLGKMGPQSGWYRACSKTFPAEYCYSSFFPFVIVSRRAAAYLFSQRQLEAVRQPAQDDVIHCEAFVPSCVAAGGFRFVDLEQLIPGSYALETMGMQIGKEALGRPMGYQMQIPDGIEMVHPVYTREEFVERAYRKFGLGLGRWDWVARALESEDARVISDDLKERVRQRIPENAQ